MKNANTILLFVYGTLKQGWGNNRNLSENNAEFIGEAVSADAHYSMQTVGFPILTEGGLSGASPPPLARVKGELYRVNKQALADCDRLEGHPTMYKREERQFVVGRPSDPEGALYTAWVYLIQRTGTRAKVIQPNEEGLLIWDGYDR